MPTGLLTDPTSKVVRQLLIDGSLGQSGGSVSGTSGSSDDWPIFAPNTPDLPDNVVVIKDTSGIQQGRLNNDGSEVYRPGVQILVRSNDYDTGWEKIQRIAIYLDETVLRSSAAVGSASYFVDTWSRASGPFSLGKESEGRRLETSAGTSKRYLFTLNGTLALDEI